MADDHEPILYDNEPASRWTRKSFDDFLIWCVERGASDISLVPRSKVWVRIHGVWMVVTRRKLSGDEIAALIDEMTGQDSTSAQIRGRIYQDTSYAVRVSRGIKHSFRINATACREGIGGSGIEIVARSISSTPPTIEDLKLPEDMVEHIVPENGIVLITGTMGSGKSTTLAAVLRWIAENQRRHIGTYEEPIEYDLMGLDNALGPVVQTEIPTHMESFAEAPRNAVRRAFDVILLGELRDPDTLRGMITLGGQGPAVYATLHVRNVPETIHQVIARFPSEEQPEVASKLISALRLVVHQRLVKCPEGGRTLVKEYLPFTPDVRRKLVSCPLDRLIPTIERMVEESGLPLIRDAENHYEAGRIGEEEWRVIQGEIEQEKAERSID